MALDPITAGLDFGRTLIDAIVSRIPDPNEAARTRAALEQAQAAAVNAQTMAQIGVNQAEAGSASLFVAGWRPFIGWVCGSALVFQYLVRPLAPWLAGLCGVPVPPLPGLDDNLWQLVLGMLGLGGLRSWEKVQGVAAGPVRR